MKVFTSSFKTRSNTILAAAFFLALWKLAASGINTEIILPSPERVLKAFLEIIKNGKFLPALGASALRGLFAFCLSMLLGSAAGFIFALSKTVESAFSPLMTVIRATPVLAVILLALIWFKSDFVPVFSAVIMAFPVVTAEIALGVKSVDPKLIEMARVFGSSARDRNLYIRLPSAMPHVLSAAKNALGLSWKVIVAGEVLSQPEKAIGTGMQYARVMLETAEVFAWASAAVLLCAMSDAIFDHFGKKLAWPTK